MKAPFAIVLTLLLSACAVGPDYKQVSVQSALVDQQWHAPLPHGGKVADLTQWWAQFDDPALTQLIERAQKDSPTLDAALARVKQARASAQKSDAALFPTVTGSASARRSQTGGGMGGTIVQNSTLYGLDAAWEIDIFGGKRRAVEQSEAQLQSSEAGWHDARVTLAAEIADAYVSYRACESNVKLYERRLTSQNETLELVTYKVKAGLVSSSDGNLSEASAKSIASNLENQKGVCAQGFNLIRQLTSIPAAELSGILSAKTARVPLPRTVEVASLPAATIEQRPDVAAAERDLAAATAAIGVAEAARLPSLSLTGSISRSKTGGSTTLSLWSFGPALSLPIFNAGALAAEADRTRAAMEEALATYRETVRRAVKEVEDALARLDAVSRRMGKAESSVANYRQYLAATEASYKAGSVSLLDLEESRRTVYSAEETLIAARQERAQAWIAMYKAVGGGWINTAKITK